MDIQKYRVLLSVIEHKSLTKAAEALNYTQPGISLIISSLEKELGLKLVVRTKNGIIPSNNMLHLKNFIQQIVFADDKIHEVAHKINGLEIGELKIGSFISISTQWLPAIISAFAQKHPKIDLHVLVGTYSELQHLLADNTIDIALTSAPLYPGCDFIPLCLDPILAVMSSKHSLAQCEAVDLLDLSKYPFIVPNKGSDEVVTAIMEYEHINPEIHFHIQGDLITLSLTERDFGVTIMPEIVTRLSATCVCRPLKQNYCRQLGIAVPSLKNVTPSLSSFIEVVEDFIKSSWIPYQHDSSIVSGRDYKLI